MDLNKYLCDPAEKPLERIVDDGGFTSIFRTIAFVGDSLSSGEFQSTDPEGVKQGYHDYFEYSWGQYIARACGLTAYNFSRGGMRANWYLESFAEQNGYWDTDKLAQAYVIALGVNDLFNAKLEPGTLDDVDVNDYHNNKDTFAGNYARIIQRYKELQPHAKFFLLTTPRGRVGSEELQKIHRDLMYGFAEMFEYTYVIDLYEYGPVYDSEFRKNFFLGGHMNPQGYILTAKMVMSYIDYIIRHNMQDFAQVPFIGKGVHNYTAKW